MKNKKEKFLVLDDDKGKDIKDLILLCLLDEDKIRSFKITKKSKGFKVWIYHNISLETLNNYENQYKKELEEIKKFFKKEKIKKEKE